MKQIWDELTIGDLGTIVTGKTPKAANPEHWGNNLPFLTPSDMDGSRSIETTQRGLSKAGSEAFRRFIVPRGVGVSCIGWQMGKSVLIVSSTLTNQQINSIIPDASRVNDLWLYYALSTRREEFFRLGSGGSRTPILNKTSFSKLPIRVPPLEVQRRIAGVLGALDDKIELNRRMNQTIQEIAQAIFKSWFIDFDGRDDLVDSELGPIPSSHIVGTVENLCELNPEVWKKKNHPPEVNYLDLSNVKWGSFVEPTAYQWEDAPMRARRVLREGDTLIGTVRPANGSFGLIGVSSMQLTGSTGFAVLRPLSIENTYLLYLHTTRKVFIDYLAAVAHGSAYPAVKPEIITESQISIPPVSERKRFHEIVQPLFERRRTNEQESGVLADLRDTLLPKLISGEMRIPESIEVPS